MNQDLAVTEVAPAMELIVLRQLPVIEDRLKEIKPNIDRRVENALSTAFDSGSIKVAKKFRAELNKEAKEQDDLRKAIKNKAMEPISQFERTFKECSSDAYKQADNRLKAYIEAGEKAIKDSCENGLRAFFDEYAEANGIAFLKYEQAGIVVSMADTEAKTQPPKKLRDQIEKFILRVCMDVDMILNLENAPEILAEYKQTLNATQAISTVAERHRKIEEANAEQEQRNTVKAQEEETARKFEAFAPPTVAEAPAPPDVIPVCTMNIYNETRERLKLLKQWLDANGFKYE